MPVNLFDASYYRSANSDLAGLNDGQARAHFQKFGLDEGRLFSPYADLSFYRASNSDLAGLTNRQLYDHLSIYGIAEGRKFSSVVDLNLYRHANQDLVELNNQDLFEHLRTYGVAEGRVFSYVFDANYYLGIHSDLNAGSGGNKLDGFNHFTIYGLKEGRSAAISFDVNSYRNLNSDISWASNRELLQHFQVYGLDEGRIATDKFNVRHYLDNNSDLSAAGYSYRQAYEHFIRYGLQEGRNASRLITSDFAGNSLDTARNVHLNSQGLIIRDGIGGTDTADVYRFTIDSDNTNVQVDLRGLSSNADLQLLASDGNILASSVNPGNANEVIDFSLLGQGTYYIQVYSGSTEASTNYNLRLSATLVSDYSQSGRTSPATTTTPTTGSNADPFIQRVLELTNIERSRVGLPALRLNSQLNQAAQKHSQDMGDRDYFSHTGYNGSSVGDRIYEAGYLYSYAGENIAAGQITPEAVVRAWMNSKGHRENILNPNYEEIGIGYYYLGNDVGNVNYNHYWTQNFGTA